MNGCASTVNTRNPERGHSPLQAALQTTLAAAAQLALQSESDCRVVVGYSGGLDSHVLAVLVAQWLRQQPHASARALHIDHGLHADSGAWRDHCQQICHGLNLPFQSLPLKLGSASQANLEALARDARYAAFASNMRDGEILLTAHHADDQAETLLLQLLRGAGVNGLAAMPAVRRFGPGLHARPLLAMSHQPIQQYAHECALSWIDDPSNENHRFDRNLIRGRIMPLLRQRWPAAVQNLARSAGHCAEAATLLDVLAAEDLPGYATQTCLPVRSFHALSAARRRNLLRSWVASHGLTAPSTAQLAQMDLSLLQCDAATAGDVQWANGQIRRYADDLYLGVRGTFNDAAPFDYCWDNLDEPLSIAELGKLLRRDDIPAHCRRSPLRVHSRRGGEKLPIAGQPHRKRLKNWCQERRIPPWQRSRLVLFSHADELLGVAGPF